MKARLCPLCFDYIRYNVLCDELGQCRCSGRAVALLGAAMVEANTVDGVRYLPRPCDVCGKRIHSTGRYFRLVYRHASCRAREGAPNNGILPR